MNAISAERTDAGIKLAAQPVSDYTDPIGRIGALFLDSLDVVVNDDDATVCDHLSSRSATSVRWVNCDDLPNRKGTDTNTQLQVGVASTIQATGGWV